MTHIDTNKTRGLDVRTLTVLILALLTILSVAMITTIPSSDAAETSGECGDGLTWTLTENQDDPTTYTLRIEGTGTVMADYSLPFLSSPPPWFSSASSITSISLPDGLTYIGKYAFMGTAIESITIPSSVQSIGTSAFLECNSLSSVNFTDLTVLTSVGASAFERCNLTSVDLSESKITTISAGAFQMNYGLTSAVLPATVTKLDNQAFMACDDLASLTIPEDSQLETIGDSALWSTGFTKLDLSNAKSLSLIGSSALQDCANLEEIVLPETDSVTIEGYQFVGDTNLTTIDMSKVESISFTGERTFADSGITELDLSNATFTTIEQTLLGGCNTLTKVTLPDTLTSIGQKAFYNLPALNEVVLKDPSKLESIGASAFVSTAITSLDLSETQITSIPDDAFWLCRSLESVNLPATVTSIGSGAFSATGLTNINFEDLTSLTTIGPSAFEAASLTDVDLSKTQVETIMDGAFHNNDSLRSVTVPTTVTEIKPQSFNQCANLETLVIPEESELTTIGKNAFSSTGMESVDLSNATKLTTLGDSAFGDNPSLSDVKLPDSITTVPPSAFTDSPIENVAVGDSFTVILDPNGGEGEREFQIMKSDTILLTNTFVRGGCTFEGWNTEPDGTGTAYEDQATFNKPSEGSSIVLYAQWSDPIIIIGNQGYDTLTEAIAAAEDGDTITLQTSITEDVVVTSGKNITLDLNGNKITNVTGHTITVQDEATLTITGNGTVDNLKHQKAAVYNLGTVTLESGTLTRSAEASKSPSDNGGNSYYVVHNSGTFNMNGGTITQNGYYSSLFANKSENGSTPVFNMTSGTLWQDGFIALKNEETGTVKITGGDVISKDEQSMQNWGTATISGGTLTGMIISLSYSTANGQDFDATTNIEGGTINGDIRSWKYTNKTVPANTAPEIKVSGGTINGSFEAIEGESSSTATEVDFAESGIEVSGGTFSEPVPEDCVAEGTILVPNDNGSYGTTTTDKALIQDSGTTIAPIVTDGSSYVLTSSGSHDNVTVTIQFQDGTIVLNGDFQKGAYTVVLDEELDLADGMEAGFRIVTGDIEIDSITVTVKVPVDDGYLLTSAMVYHQEDGSEIDAVGFAPDSFTGDGTVTFTTDTNSHYWIDATFETVQTGPDFPPIWDDDDDYVPPVIPSQTDDSNDDDTTTIVACAAAAVVAALMAAFLIIERRRN